jgi:arylsulfatase
MRPPRCLPLVAILAALAADACAEPPRRPNIVLLVTDDQGFGDVSANGNPVLRTPALDRLHREGVRFTDFHVSPTCAPTRSALFTGRHEFKNGVTHTILERERLTLKATTLAQVLRSAGYSTGLFGKWHLGDEDAYQPGRRGFDEAFIHGAGGIGQTYPGSCGDAPGNSYFDPYILHNGRFEKTRGYCTDVFYRQALGWIDARRDEGKPFFATIATNAPHAPLDVRPEDAAPYEGKGLPPDAAKFFGMIHNIDANIAQLLDRLDEWGIARDTLVVFLNDNGGTAGVKVYNAGMRGAKGSAWLGGTRASSFWRWPGTLKPADCDALTAHVDVFPTLAAIAGATLPDDVKGQVEGRSLLPLLENPNAPWPDRVLFTHVGRWPKGTNPEEWKFRMAAARSEHWSLVSPDGGREPKWRLFDLEADYGQTTDVLAQHPDIAKDLAAAYDRWWGECRPLMVNEDAALPPINPFQERFYRQFGGQPTAEDLRKMDLDHFLHARPAAAAPKARPRAR